MSMTKLQGCINRIRNQKARIGQLKAASPMGFVFSGGRAVKVPEALKQAENKLQAIEEELKSLRQQEKKLLSDLKAPEIF